MSLTSDKAVRLLAVIKESIKDATNQYLFQSNEPYYETDEIRAFYNLIDAEKYVNKLKANGDILDYEITTVSFDEIEIRFINPNHIKLQIVLPSNNTNFKSFMSGE